VSYDHGLLHLKVSLSLQRKPNSSLGELSRELHVSRRTIQNAVISATGKSFRELQKETLLTRVQSILLARPSVAIKELSDDVGYRSPRSFARAVRHACGISLEQLRTRIVRKCLAYKT
jgi:AraC-like DNA-binding protein